MRCPKCKAQMKEKMLEYQCPECGTIVIDRDADGTEAEEIQRDFIQ